MHEGSVPCQYCTFTAVFNSSDTGQDVCVPSQRGTTHKEPMFDSILILLDLRAGCSSGAPSPRSFQRKALSQLLAAKHSPSSEVVSRSA